MEREQLELVRGAGLLAEVSGEVEMVRGVSVLPTGGHTRGSQAVLIGTDEAGLRAEDPHERAIFWGDLIPTRWQIPVRWTSAFDDYPIDAVEIRNRARAARGRRGLVVLLHARPWRPADPDRGDREGQLPHPRGLIRWAPARAGIMGAPLERSPLCVRSTLIRTASRRSLPALAGVLALILAACSSPASVTPLPSGAEPPSDCARVESGVITLSAQDLEFSAPCMVANAGEAFTIHFTNNDSQPHDVNVYADSSKGETLIDGDVITEQGESLDDAVDAMEEGSYYFDCSIHPEMNGTLYVVAAT